MTTDAPSFERVPGEPARAWHSFCHYRDGGPMRSLDTAWRQHVAVCVQAPEGTHKGPIRRRPQRWSQWSVRWGWVERSAAFDRHLDRQKVAALEAEQVEAGRRHARLLAAMMSVLTVPVRVALETATTPAGMQLLRTAALANATGLRAVIAEARAGAQVLPELIRSERLVLGLTTASDEFREAPTDDPVAARIVSDPVSVALAVELLDRATRAVPPVPSRRLTAVKER